MRVLMWLASVLLLLLGLLLAALALGTFGNMSSEAPLWLRSLGTVEAALGSRTGTFGLALFTRAALLTVLASSALALATYFKPRPL